MKANSRKLASLLLVLALTLSMAIPAFAATANDFDDISSSDWHYEYVDFMVTNQYMLGTGATTWSPNELVTRAMFVTVLGRVAEADINNNATTAFQDVPVGQWFSGSVKWAADTNLVTGYNASTFGTHDNITREDIAVLIMRYIDLFEDRELEEKPKVATFPDEASISNYAKDAVDQCRVYGLLYGRTDTGNFDPKANATRAEVAAIIARMSFLLDEGETPVEPVPVPPAPGGGSGPSGPTIKTENLIYTIKATVQIGGKTLTLSHDYPVTVTTSGGAVTSTSSDVSVDDMMRDLLAANEDEIKDGIEFILNKLVTDVGAKVNDIQFSVDLDKILTIPAVRTAMEAEVDKLLVTMTGQNAQQIAALVTSMSMFGFSPVDKGDVYDALFDALNAPVTFVAKIDSNGKISIIANLGEITDLTLGGQSLKTFLANPMYGGMLSGMLNGLSFPYDLGTVDVTEAFFNLFITELGVSDVAGALTELQNLVETETLAAWTNAGFGVTITPIVTTAIEDIFDAVDINDLISIDDSTPGVYILESFADPADFVDVYYDALVDVFDILCTARTTARLTQPQYEEVLNYIFGSNPYFVSVSGIYNAPLTESLAYYDSDVVKDIIAGSTLGASTFSETTLLMLTETISTSSTATVSSALQPILGAYITDLDKFVGKLMGLFMYQYDFNLTLKATLAP